MKYDDIVKECEKLGYRDKLRLSQHLIVLARKEEEIQHPQNRSNLKHPQSRSNPKQDNISGEPSSDIESIHYVIDRITKLRPGKKKSLLNCIKAMYQFQGGVSEEDQVNIIRNLEKQKFLRVESNNKITYLDDKN